MPGALILVVITATTAGGVSAAFVNGLNAPTCKERGETIRSILQSENIEILRLGCFRGTATFERFMHGTDPDAPRHAYRTTLNGDSVTVEPLKDMASCKERSVPDATNKAIERHCVTSTQKLLSNAPALKR